MQTLYTQNPAQMPPESVIQIRGAYHRVSSLLETLEINDRWIGALRERAMALVTQEQSAAISRLTGLAAFFLPAIAVIALFGITGDLLSGLTPTVTLAVAGVAAVVVGALVATLTRQK
jgi:Mg2+ and Co2+ transporter CorA